MHDGSTSGSTPTNATLRRDALGLRHAIVISVAVMSPAASIFFNTIPQAGQVGAAIPLCYVVGFIVAALVANQYSEFSREIPSSGSSYTFVSQGLGTRAGFMNAWFGLAAIALGVPYSFVLLSANVQILVLRWFGLDLPWSIWLVLLIGVAFAMCYWGIRQSMNVDLVFLAFEIGVCLVLAALVLWHAGQHGGLSAAPFNPGSIPEQGSLVVGVVLGVLSYIGFETAATLGEETRNPHRNIPRAVFGSMIVVGLFYVLMAYVGTIGYGITKMATGFANDPAPFDTIGRQYSGPWLVVLIDLVGLLSFLSAAIAIINGGSRVMYAIAREGVLPSWLAWLHPVRQTPVGAVIIFCSFGLVVGLLLGYTMTPIGAFGFLGTLDALFVLIIYAMVCVASMAFFRQKRRTRLSVVRHGIAPVLATLLITAIFLLVFISPETPPLNLVPYILVIWAALGCALLFMVVGRKDTLGLPVPDEESTHIEGM
jgi:amino acid transporter